MLHRTIVHMDSNAFDVDIHFRTKIRLLRYFSTWWTNPSTLWLHILEKSLSAIRIALMMLASICQLIQLTKMSNLKGASEIVEVMTLTITSSYKSAFFLYYQKDYAAMLNLMRCYFYERPLFLRCKTYTNMSKFLCYTDLITYLYFISAIILISFSIIATTLVPESKNPQLLSTCKPNLTFPDCSSVQHNLNPALPLKIWLPVDYSWTPLYQIIHLLTSFILYDCCLIYVAQDVFCFTLLYAVCGQFQILEESLMNLGNLANGRLMYKYEETGRSYPATVQGLEKGNDLQKTLSSVVDDNLNNEKLLHRMFGDCVQQHILLLKLLRDYEKLMESMIIVDFLHAICSLSFALLELSVAHTLIHAIKLFSFIAICIVHQYMNNFFGEMVIQKQLSISRAVYSLPWEEYPKKIKSSILFMLLRTEKPIVINGFKMYLLCYKTFVEFLKAIISYYTVLRNVHLEK